MLSPLVKIRAQSLVNRITTDQTQRQLIMQRLEKLDDKTFNDLSSNLTSRRYYLANFFNEGYQNLPNTPTMVKIKFVYTDVITGESGTGRKLIPNSLFEPVERLKEVTKIFHQPLEFVKSIDGNQIIFNPELSYNIPNITTPLTTGGGTTGGTTGGGQSQPEPASNTKSNFEIKSLILPGLILVGGYFLVRNL